MKTFPFCFPFFVFQVCQLSSERSSDGSKHVQAVSYILRGWGFGIKLPGLASR